MPQVSTVYPSDLLFVICGNHSFLMSFLGTWVLRPGAPLDVIVFMNLITALVLAAFGHSDLLSVYEIHLLVYKI